MGVSVRKKSNKSLNIQNIKKKVVQRKKSVELVMDGNIQYQHIYESSSENSQDSDPDPEMANFNSVRIRPDFTCQSNYNHDDGKAYVDPKFEKEKNKQSLRIYSKFA